MFFSSTSLRYSKRNLLGLSFGRPYSNRLSKARTAVLAKILSSFLLTAADNTARIDFLLETLGALPYQSSA